MAKLSRTRKARKKKLAKEYKDSVNQIISSAIISGIIGIIVISYPFVDSEMGLNSLKASIFYAVGCYFTFISLGVVLANKAALTLHYPVALLMCIRDPSFFVTYKNSIKILHENPEKYNKLKSIEDKAD